MTRYRNRLPIAALILAGASVLAPPRAASAQGALQTRGREIAAAPAGESALQPARSVLHQLVGRWRLAIWFAGNFDGPPDATGTRVAATLYDDLRLEWTETHDDSSHSQGVLGFDPRVVASTAPRSTATAPGASSLTGPRSPANRPVPST